MASCFPYLIDVIPSKRAPICDLEYQRLAEPAEFYKFRLPDYNARSCQSCEMMVCSPS
jgi:hypothetical protein